MGGLKWEWSRNEVNFRPVKVNRAVLRIKCHTPSNCSVRVPLETSRISWRNSTASSVRHQIRHSYDTKSFTSSRPSALYAN